MAERFVYSTGTISIANGASSVTGSGTAWSGQDRAGAQIFAVPADGEPFLVGVVAEVDPRGIYENLTLPLVAPYEGEALAGSDYMLLAGPALANGATQAAIYARFTSFLEENMGLTGNLADQIDWALVPNNSLFIDAATRQIFQWRNGILNVVYSVGAGFNPRGAWVDDVEYETGDLVSHDGSVYVSNQDGNLDNEPDGSDEWWTQIPVVIGADGREIELRVDGTNLEWKYDDEVSWTLLFDLSALQGESAYVYVGYAETDDGSGFSLTPDASRPYIAFLSTDTEIETPSAGDFTGLWRRYEGLSAYEVALANGFVGTEGDWLESLESTVPGPQGEIGPQGEQGEQGPQGSQGETGPTGPANNLTIGDVTSGSAPDVEITGTSPNQVLNFVLEKGDTGAPGESAFVYHAYAEDDEGTGFSLAFDPALEWEAILTTDTENETPIVTDFDGLWRRWKGTSGYAGEPWRAEVVQASGIDAGVYPITRRYPGNATFTDLFAEVLAGDGSVLCYIEHNGESVHGPFEVSGAEPYHTGALAIEVEPEDTLELIVLEPSGLVEHLYADLYHLSSQIELAAVATSGSYDDLTDQPAIPDAQVNADWNASSGVAEILNKPVLGTMASEDASDYTPTSGLAGVATSGDYDDLSNRPTLGGAAALDVGTTAGTVAAGDDSRITGAAQKSANLSDMANVLTARANLKILIVTETEYAALDPPDPDTIYHVIEDAP